ncbi:hypothetical protein [Aureimonas sp. AU4]|uniref:hypothetical protein n=1 Tax=Aureimonas sp. AU4 TaxID=1638163 RepID=UPI0007851403|nr:hypothetical protein [Aureimonas sp. AU4]
MRVPLLLLLAGACALPALPAAAQPYAPNEAGTILTAREREYVTRRVRLPDGRIVLLTENDGLPWLFGAGSSVGAASSVPLVDGRTPSIAGSTPSGGIVPGQEAE